VKISFTEIYIIR